MAWTIIPNSDVDVDSAITTSLMTALRDNVAAAFNKDTNAPVLANDYVVLAMMANDSVDQSNIVANAVGQSEVKTATGAVSGRAGQYTLPGGQYGFYPRTYQDNAGSGSKIYSAQVNLNSSSSSYGSYIYLTPDDGSNAPYAEQTYFTASKPYDLGDGEIPLFVFVIIDNATNNVDGVYVAPEAPWHYNGKTSIIASRKDLVTGKSYKMERGIIVELRDAKMDIKAAVAANMYTRDVIADRLINDGLVEVEITQDIKNADMGDFPHPFLGNNLTGKTVAMLDPVSTERLLALHDEGENINKLLHDGSIVINNSPLVRATPQGVQAYGFKL